MIKPVLLGCMLVVLAAFDVLVLGAPIGVFVNLWREQDPGPFDRPRFEAIVAQVRQAQAKPLAIQEFKLTSLHDPKSLRPLQPGERTARGQGAGRVWAETSSAGKLAVVIQTRDLGHAGEYGFAYSDQPLTPEPFASSNWFSLKIPGPIKLVQPRMKIDEHWWGVVNNLD